MIDEEPAVQLRQMLHLEARRSAQLLLLLLLGTARQ
jgi:hypothetical protein